VLAQVRAGLVRQAIHARQPSTVDVVEQPMTSTFPLPIAATCSWK
jgi:hypothetical protein